MGNGNENRGKFTRTQWMSTSLAHSRDWGSFSRITLAAGSPSRHVRHALTVQINFADVFNPCEHVIHSLAAESHQFRTDDARHKITRQIENLLWRRAVESFAENRCHRASERLHFWAEGHANVCLALFIDLQINTDCVGAFLVFPNVDEIKILALARRLPFRIVRI